MEDEKNMQVLRNEEVEMQLKSFNNTLTIYVSNSIGVLYIYIGWANKRVPDQHTQKLRSAFPVESRFVRIDRFKQGTRRLGVVKPDTKVHRYGHPDVPEWT